MVADETRQAVSASLLRLGPGNKVLIIPTVLSRLLYMLEIFYN